MLFSLTARLGYDILRQLGWFVFTVVLGLAIHQFGVYALSVRLLGGMSPRAFYRGVRPAMITAFSTASSNATLPTALEVAEENLKLPPQVSRFVLTLGSTANQNGTALFEGDGALPGPVLRASTSPWLQQVLVVFICILGGIGTAGVPAGSIPVVAMILGLHRRAARRHRHHPRRRPPARHVSHDGQRHDLAAAVVVSRGEERVV
ncbi:MAG: cation:dicarboxylase symporter family transporter [Candidatus Binatia bacterium]